jgi:hypothetical protein
MAGSPHCPICLGSGWVCEDHGTHSYAHDTDPGCGDTSGVPCSCNLDPSDLGPGYTSLANVNGDEEKSIH